MLRGGKRRSSGNDTTLSDRELRKVEVASAELEQNLEDLRAKHEQREENLIDVMTCVICLETHFEEPMNMLFEPCGHRVHVSCWINAQKLSMNNYRRAQKMANMQKNLGQQVDVPHMRDFMRCPRCQAPFQVATDLSGMP